MQEVEMDLPQFPQADAGAKGGAVTRKKAAEPEPEPEEEEEEEGEEEGIAVGDKRAKADPEAEAVAATLMQMILGARISRYRPKAKPDYRQDLHCLGCSIAFRPDNPEDPAHVLLCTSCRREAELNPEGIYES